MVDMYRSRDNKRWNDAVFLSMTSLTTMAGPNMSKARCLYIPARKTLHRNKEHILRILSYQMCIFCSPTIHTHIMQHCFFCYTCTYKYAVNSFINYNNTSIKSIFLQAKLARVYNSSARCPSCSATRMASAPTRVERQPHTGCPRRGNSQ